VFDVDLGLTSPTLHQGLDPVFNKVESKRLANDECEDLYDPETPEAGEPNLMTVCQRQKWTMFGKQF
jgi:hypothetical protein